MRQEPTTSAPVARRVARGMRYGVYGLVLLGLLTSCALGVRTRALTGGKLQVDVRVADTANQNRPVAMDVLLVYDKALLKELLQLSANEWFEKREQFRRDDPESEAFQVWSWEWIPGQRQLVELPLEAKAKSGLVFAQYAPRGVHRARLEPHTSVVIELQEKTFSVRPMP
ncbi:MAG: hypothetical protein AB7N91_24675 [Candidatus Tectimicrobiota bacterium]